MSSQHDLIVAFFINRRNPSPKRFPTVRRATARGATLATALTTATAHRPKPSAPDSPPQLARAAAHQSNDRWGPANACPPTGEGHRDPIGQRDAAPGTNHRARPFNPSTNGGRPQSPAQSLLRFLFGRFGAKQENRRCGGAGFLPRLRPIR